MPTETAQREPTLEKADGSEEDETAASEIADELMEVERETVDGDVVRCEIVDVRPRRSKYEVEVEFPSGRTETQRFNKPEAWTSEYEFVEFVQVLGYDNPAAVEQLPGSACEVRLLDGSDWEFDALYGWRDRVNGWVSGSSWLVPASGGLTATYLFLLVLHTEIQGGFQAAFLAEALLFLFVFMVFPAVFALGALLTVAAKEEFF